jgi:hypothetical protein
MCSVAIRIASCERASARSVEGPLVPGGPPVVTDVIGRRYACRACDAIVVVLPRGVARGHRYSLSATRWASLARLTRCALALFGCEPPGLGTVRERAARVAAFVASKDTAGGVAVFRAQVIGPLLTRAFTSHGELADAIRVLARHKHLPPGASVTRFCSEATLERWYYRFKRRGLQTTSSKLKPWRPSTKTESARVGPKSASPRCSKASASSSPGSSSGTTTPVKSSAA